MSSDTKCSMARLVYPVPLAVASRATLLDLLRYVANLEIILVAG